MTQKFAAISRELKHFLKHHTLSTYSLQIFMIWNYFQSPWIVVSIRSCFLFRIAMSHCFVVTGISLSPSSLWFSLSGICSQVLCSGSATGSSKTCHPPGSFRGPVVSKRPKLFIRWGSPCQLIKIFNFITMKLHSNSQQIVSVFGKLGWDPLYDCDISL